jgi:hypothetical protein
MDNFSEISKNEARFATGAKRSKADKRWTLIFIGNHGKTITLERFKGMVLLTCLVVGVTIAIAAGLLYLSLITRQEKKQLESDLQDLKAQIKAIRYEKDVLMTKLVLAESRSKASPAKTAPQPVESAAPQQNPDETDKPRSSGATETPGQSTQLAKAQKAPASETNAELPAAENQSEPGLSVALEDFKISPRVDENVLSVQFKIKNTTPNSRRVSGHAIVVLKGEQLQQNKWLSIPGVSLADGKPTGRQRGYTFGINYFKTMRFKANLPKSLSVYQTATVFIFTRNGDLLLEQDFPVNLAAALPATASKPTSQAPAAASKPSSSQTAGEPPPAAASNPPTTTQPATSRPTATSTDDSLDPSQDSTNE